MVGYAGNLRSFLKAYDDEDEVLKAVLPYIDRLNVLQVRVVPADSVISNLGDGIYVVKAIS